MSLAESELVKVSSQNEAIYDPSFVKELFDRCSSRYIAFSYFCSLGFTERWRRQCVDLIGLSKSASPRGIDLMSGTGEVWPHLLRRFPQIESITAVDISSGMHQRAMSRLHRLRAHKIEFIEDDALNSELPENCADFVVSTFGLKTFNKEQQARLAGVTARILKPGGSFAFIEASDPQGWLFRPLYLFHLKTLLPLVERFLLKGAQDFAMIGQYCTKFADASYFAGELDRLGLETCFQKRFFGCASVVFGRKPG